MSRRHYNLYNNMIEGNLNIDLVVRVEADNVGKVLHLCRMNRRNMPNNSASYCRIQVDWGDGVVETVDVTQLYTTSYTASFTHTYSAVGDYNISLTQLTDKRLTRPYWISFTKPSTSYIEVPIIQINRFNFNGVSIKELISGSVNPLSITDIKNINIPDVNDLNNAFNLSSKLKTFDIKGVSNISVPILNLNTSFNFHSSFIFNLNQLTDNWDISQVTDVTSCFAGNSNMTGTGQAFIDRLPSGVAGNPYYAAYLFQDCTSLSDYNSIDNLYKDN